MKASTIAYLTLSLSWTLYASSTLFFFYKKRHSPVLRFREARLTIVGTVAAILITDTHLFRFAYLSSFPCYLLLWIPSVCFPVLVFTFLVRCLRLGTTYRMSQRKLRRSARCSEESLEDEGELKDGGNTRIYLHENDVKRLKHLTERNARAEEANPRPWPERYAEVLNDFLTIRTTSLLIIGGILLQCFVLTFVQSLTTDFSPGVTSCRFGWEFVPFYVLLLVNIIPGFPILLLSRGVRDAYGIQLELDTTIILTSFGYVLSLMFDMLKSRGILKSIIVIFPAPNWLIIVLMALHHVNVVVPVIEAYWKPYQADPTGWLAFRQMLIEPKTLQEFREFTAREFSIENVLFYETLQVVRHLRGVDDWELRCACREVYQQFVKPGAELELNLLSSTAHQVRKVFEKGPPEEISVEVFDQVEREVLRLMYESTYPRFLQFRENLGGDVKKRGWRWGRKR